MKRIESIIQNLDNFIEDHFHATTPLIPDIVKSKILRARKEFDAKRFFILVVGPVKSGKSTLVNLFARNYVSPTSYVECTVRPSIIIKDKPNLIQQYRIKGDSDEDKRKTFNTIIDNIRGLVPLDDVLKIAEREVYPLNSNNIEKYIALPIENYKLSEISLTVINTEGGGLINDEIVIIDMPGLDGLKVDQTNPIFEEMVSRADFFIFVQSTSSAINKAANEFLTKLYSASQIPVWLVHNVHESDYWRSQEEKKKKIEEHIEIGKLKIKEHFGINNFNSTSLNLGKINDIIFHELNEFEEKYHQELTDAKGAFIEFEKTLYQFLNEKKGEIKERNCIDNVRNILEKSIQQLQEENEKSVTQKDKILTDIRNTENLLPEIGNNHYDVDKVIVEMSTVIEKEGYITNWITSVKGQSDLDTLNDKISGKELIDKLQKIAQKCSGISNMDQNSRFYLHITQGHLLNNLISQTQSTLDKIKEVFRQAGIDKKISLLTDIEEYTPSISDQFSAFTEDIKTRKQANVFGLKFDTLKKIYSKEEAKEYRDKQQKYFEQEIFRKEKAFREQLKAKYQKLFDDNNNHLTTQLNTVIKDYKQQMQPEINKIDQNIQNLNTIISQLKEISKL